MPHIVSRSIARFALTQSLDRVDHQSTVFRTHHHFALLVNGVFAVKAKLESKGISVFKGFGSDTDMLMRIVCCGPVGDD